jgi:hypothetical protein
MGRGGEASGAGLASGANGRAGRGEEQSAAAAGSPPTGQALRNLASFVEKSALALQDGLLRQGSSGKLLQLLEAPAEDKRKSGRRLSQREQEVNRRASLRVTRLAAAANGDEGAAKELARSGAATPQGTLKGDDVWRAMSSFFSQRRPGDEHLTVPTAAESLAASPAHPSLRTLVQQSPQQQPLHLQRQQQQQQQQQQQNQQRQRLRAVFSTGANMVWWASPESPNPQRGATQAAPSVAALRASIGRQRYHTMRPTRRLDDQHHGPEHEGVVQRSGAIYVQGRALNSWVQVYFNLFPTGLALYTEQAACRAREGAFLDVYFQDLVLPTGKVAEELNSEAWARKRRFAFCVNTEDETFCFATLSDEERRDVIKALDLSYAAHLERRIRKQALMQIAWNFSKEHAAAFSAASDAAASSAAAAASAPSVSASASAAASAAAPASSSGAAAAAAAAGEAEKQPCKPVMGLLGRRHRSLQRLSLNQHQRKASTTSVSATLPVALDDAAARKVLAEMVQALEEKLEHEFSRVLRKRKALRALLAWRAVAKYSKSLKSAAAARG